MSDLAYDVNTNTPTRTKAKLEIALDPTVTPLVYSFVPSANQIGGYKPGVTTNRTPLFNDESGNSQTAASVVHRAGAQTFQTIAGPKNLTVKKMIQKGSEGDPQNHDVMARYTDPEGVSYQGQAKLVYTGEEGTGPDDTLIRGFTLEWTRVGAPTFPV